MTAARKALSQMRANDEIGDAAFHRVEEELDWVEMSRTAPMTPGGLVFLITHVTGTS